MITTYSCGYCGSTFIEGRQYSTHGGAETQSGWLTCVQCEEDCGKAIKEARKKIRQLLSRRLSSHKEVKILQKEHIIAEVYQIRQDLVHKRNSRQITNYLSAENDILQAYEKKCSKLMVGLIHKYDMPPISVIRTCQKRAEELGYRNEKGWWTNAKDICS